MPLPGQTPEGPEGKYTPVQMAEWLITEAASFKDPQDLLAEMGRQGFEMTPSEGGMAEEMPLLAEEPLPEEGLPEEGFGEEPPEESPKGPGKKGPAFLEMIRIEAAGKAVDKDKKNKEKANKEEEEY